MTDIAAILNAYPVKLDHVDQDAFILVVEECGNCARCVGASVLRRLLMDDD